MDFPKELHTEQILSMEIHSCILPPLILWANTGFSHKKTLFLKDAHRTLCCTLRYRQGHVGGKVAGMVWELPAGGSVTVVQVRWPWRPGTAQGRCWAGSPAPTWACLGLQWQGAHRNVITHYSLSCKRPERSSPTLKWMACVGVKEWPLVFLASCFNLLS